jgi:hypothetical protein
MRASTLKRLERFNAGIKILEDVKKLEKIHFL